MKYVASISALALVMLSTSWIHTASADEPEPPASPEERPSEEVPQDEHVPPNRDGAPEANEGEVPQVSGPADLRSLLRQLRAQLSIHEKSPVRGKFDRAAVDAWRSILKPRARRMSRRVDWLMGSDRWLRPENNGSWVHMRPRHWSKAVREIAALYTELGGAMNQYETVRVKVTSPLGLGAQRPQNRNPYDGYPPGHLELISLERNFDHRLHRGKVIWRHELDYYHRLAGHVAAEMARREEARLAWEAKQAAVIEDIEQMHLDNLKYMEHQRETLQFQMLSLRAIVATMQASEEHRIRILLAEWRGDVAVSSDADTFLQGMRDARLEARGHDARAYSRYGSLLRLKWLRSRQKIIKLLDKAGLTKDGLPIVKTPSSPQPATLPAK